MRAKANSRARFSASQTWAPSQRRSLSDFSTHLNGFAAQHESHHPRSGGREASVATHATSPEADTSISSGKGSQPVFSNRQRGSDSGCGGGHANSPVLAHLMKAFGEAATVLPCDRLPYVATRTDWATVKLGFGSNLRTNIDRYIRRIQKDYKCQFSRVRTSEQLEEFMEAFVQLHQERWQSKGEPGHLRCPTAKHSCRRPCAKHSAVTEPGCGCFSWTVSAWRCCRPL